MNATSLCFFGILIFLSIALRFRRKKYIKHIHKQLSELAPDESAVYLDPDFWQFFIGFNFRLIKNNQSEVKFDSKNKIIKLEKGDSIQFYLGKKPVSPSYTDIDGIYAFKGKSPIKSSLIFLLGVLLILAAKSRSVYLPDFSSAMRLILKYLAFIMMPLGAIFHYNFRKAVLEKVIEHGHQ